MTDKSVDSLIPENLKRNLTLRFAVLGLCFLVLSGGSYLVVSAAVFAKEQDSVIVNLAGRQRMLTQKYSHEITQALVGLVASDWELVEQAKETATKTAKQYELILSALERGGAVDVGNAIQTWIPAAQDVEIVEHLEHVKAEWEKLKTNGVQAMRSDQSLRAEREYARNIERQTDKTIAAMDDVAWLLQMRSEAKLRQVGSKLLNAFALSVAMVLATALFLRVKIIVPLHNTMAALKTEISERKQAENESRKLWFAVEQSPAMVVITDTNGTIEYINPRFTAVTGYTSAEAIGKNPRFLKSGQWPKKAYELLWKTILSGKTWRGEFRNKKKNGDLYWESASISPVRNALDEVTHFLAVKEDITERKLKEEELSQAKVAAEAANRAKGEFLSNMSHEIRTPMTAILGYADNLLERGLSEKQRRKCVQTIRRNGDYLLEIINDILDLSKIEAEQMRIECRDCQPLRIIAEVASLMRVRANDKKVALKIEYIGSIPNTIVSDPTRIRQILLNLVGNAIKFTKTGTVRLVTRLLDHDSQPCLQFDVIDTGCGLTEAQADKLFQPFVQVDNSSTREFGGMGLGLVISKRFARMLGGDVIVSFTKEDVGSTFRATVATGPLDGVQIIDDPMTATTLLDTVISDAKLPPPDLHGLNILLAEDGADNQRLISFVLTKAGASVTVKENGQLARDAALSVMNATREDDKRPFDMILMDMQMPVMDGYEATRQLRQAGYTRPIIALTAHAMEGDRESCIKAGCDNYATKPIDRNKLAALILENVDHDRYKATTNVTTTSIPEPLSGCRILLAEDNPVNQVLIAGMLKKSGAEMTVVKDGRLAVDAALAARENNNEFDIILSDISMPILSGDEATKILRDKGYTGTIIALTAHAMTGDRQKYLGIGFDDFATKPINRAELIDTLQAHFGKTNRNVPSDIIATDTLIGDQTHHTSAKP